MRRRGNCFAPELDYRQDIKISRDQGIVRQLADYALGTACQLQLIVELLSAESLDADGLDE